MSRVNFLVDRGRERESTIYGRPTLILQRDTFAFANTPWSSHLNAYDVTRKK